MTAESPAPAPIIAVTADFATAPQLAPAHLAEAKALGYRAILCNRPDDEAPDQPSLAAMAAAAAENGLDFAALTFVGAPSLEAARAFNRWRAERPGPILAYCRSGTRSLSLYLLAQALQGAMPAALLDLAARAGYGLEALGPLLTEARAQSRS